jgi:hypothetical protein
VGFVVDHVTLGQVFFEYFDLPCQFAFRRLLHNHNHLSSWAGTIGQTVAAVPSGLGLTPWKKIIKKEKYYHNFRYLLFQIDSFYFSFDLANAIHAREPRKKSTVSRRFTIYDLRFTIYDLRISTIVQKGLKRLPLSLTTRRSTRHPR